MKYYHPDSDYWRKYELPAPETIDHGVHISNNEDDLSDKFTKLLPNEWKLEGNKLIGKTEMGLLVQMIPTDYILEATENGLPKFRRVSI